jgi:Low affinity iron permease
VAKWTGESLDLRHRRGVRGSEPAHHRGGDTNIAISIATLLMVFVLQNTQNRDSAALHLKLDEMIHAQPDAREIVRGTEVKSEAEIKGMTLEEAPDSVTPGE